MKGPDISPQEDPRSPYERPTRASLLQRAQQGNDEARNLIMTLYLPLARHWLKGWGILSDADRQDVTQEIGLCVLKKLHTFKHNGRKGAFRTWLKKIARFMALRYFDAQKKGQPMQRLDEDALQALPEAADLEPTGEEGCPLEEPVERAILKQKFFELARSKTRITEQSLECFWWTEIEGKSEEKVAGELGIKASQVAVNRSRIKSRLDDLLDLL
jgi:RNA polymerase sigma factor (sigma-70 family)